MTAPRRDKALREQGSVAKSRYGRNSYYSAFAQYESRKRSIAEAGLTPAVYAQQVTRLAAMLGV
jgi:hypothetical protein